MKQLRFVAPLFFLLILVGCGSTQIVESPKTTYVAETAEAKDPMVIWTSRAYGRDYDYLGVVTTRSLSYDGALGRLVSGGKKLHADALIDVHYQQIGFMQSLQAFAIKYK